jgi:hypothetical protein
MKIFTQTSNQAYDRHTYDVLLTSGKKISFNFWEEVQEFWFLNYQRPDYLNTIIVKDKKKQRSSGFSQ